jgi:hypothetical protein
LEVLALRNVIVQEVQQEVAFLFLEANDAATELWVHEKRLLTGGGMCADQRVDRRYWLATNDTSPVLAVVGLLDSCNTISKYSDSQP